MAAGDKFLIDSDVADNILLDSDLADILLIEAGVGFVPTAIGGYDFGDHYPHLSPADKARIDEVIEALRPVQRERLAEGLPSKAVRRKIARILPEYAAYKPKSFTELMAEAAEAHGAEDRQAQVAKQLKADNEAALIMLLLLAA